MLFLLISIKFIEKLFKMRIFFTKTKYILILLVLPFFTNCGNDDDSNNSELGGCNLNSSKIYNGDITFTTQTALSSFDNFGYTVITGDVEIIEDTSSNDPITSLNNSLKCITTIGGHLTIKNNNSLESLEGFLNNLNSINGNLRIENNDALESLENSFANVNSLANIYILDNENLVTLNEFENLNSITYSIVIVNNNSLTNTGNFCNNSSNLITLRIEGNNSLADLEGLNQLSSLHTLWIKNNPNLIEITGLTSLIDVRNKIEIINNDALTNLDMLLSNTNDILEYIIIEGNDSLLNLSGLINIRDVANIYIRNNSNLLSLSGLDNLNYLNRFRSGLHIENNDNLENIDALSNLIIAYETWFINNESLSDFCAVSPVVLGESFNDFYATNNLYNPTENDFLNGQCSQ